MSIKPPGPYGSYVVYIVDADRAVREGISRLLASAGLESRACDSVQSFLDQATRAAGACVLLNLGGAGLREPALRSRLQTLAGAVPLIALAADDDLTARHRARELGACACFRKPVDAAALLDSIFWVTQRPAPALVTRGSTILCVLRRGSEVLSQDPRPAVHLK